MKPSAPKPFKPYLWLRHRNDGSEAIWYVVQPGPAPAFEQENRSTGFRATEKALAKKVLARVIEETSRGERQREAGGEGPLTVRRLADLWLASRERKEISTVRDYRTRLELHALPVIGDMVAAEVRLEHIEGVMGAVKAKDTLASRTQRRVYEAMKAMFNWAVPRLLESSPCGLKDDELPANKDADPDWRKQANFSRLEVVQLITDTRILIDRRVLYAVMFLAGCRFGEISALRVRDYNRDWEPLPMLDISRSFNSKTRKVKGTKTDQTRLIPVHRVLAEILDWWLEVGWPAMIGRRPGPDDVLIPTRNGTHRDVSTGWKQLNGERDKDGKLLQLGDLERIGLRRRRQHDTRRTFITLCRRDGADKTLLGLVSHGPGKDMVDVYTEMSALWEPLCAEVSKLRIDLDFLSTTTPNQGHAKVSTEVSMNEILSGQQVLTTRPQRDSNPQRTVGHSRSDSDSRGQVAGRRHLVPRAGAAFAANPGHPRPMDTLDTPVASLALRQALAALDRGRIDQARDILRRAIESEADPNREAIS